MSRPTVNRLTPLELKALHSQEWEDFRSHWPMEVLYLLRDVGGGFAFGFALSLALFVFVLERVI